MLSIIIIFSSKRISPDYNNSIFELLYDKELKIIDKEIKKLEGEKKEIFVSKDKIISFIYIENL